MHMKKKLEKLNVTQKFLICGTILLGIFLVAFIFNRDLYTTLLHGIPNDSFMDFFNSVSHAMGREPYALAAIYPPLCYAFYWVCGMLMGNDAMAILENHYASQLELKQLTLPMLVFLAYFTITLVIFLWLLTQMKQGKRYEKVWLACVIMCSVPFIYQFERANIIFLSLLFTMVFFWLKDSTNKWLRELSYICLAIAAALKIYPAIFGILLVVEKRYKDAIRLMIYGIVFFFVPFLFVRGGFGTIPTFLENLTYTSTEYSATREGYKVNFSALISYAATQVSSNKILWEQIGEKSALLISALGICVLPWIKKNWKRVLLLTCILVGLPNMSFEYTVIFMIIPLIMFLDGEKNRVDKIVYTTLFILIFFPLPLGWNEHASLYAYYFYNRSFNAIQTSVALLLMTLFLIIEGGVGCYKSMLSKKKVRLYAVIVGVLCVGLLLGVMGNRSYISKIKEKEQAEKIEEKILEKYTASINQISYEGKYEGEVLNDIPQGFGIFYYEKNNDEFKVAGEWYKGNLNGEVKITYANGEYETTNAFAGRFYGERRIYNSEGDLMASGWYYGGNDITSLIESAQFTRYEELEKIKISNHEMPVSFTGSVVYVKQYYRWVNVILQDDQGNQYWFEWENELVEKGGQKLIPNVLIGDTLECYGTFEGKQEFELQIAQQELGFGIKHNEIINEIKKTDQETKKINVAKMNVVAANKVGEDVFTNMGEIPEYEDLIENPYIFVGADQRVKGEVVDKTYDFEMNRMILVVESENDKEQYAIGMDFKYVFNKGYEWSEKEKQEVMDTEHKLLFDRNVDVTGILDGNYVFEQSEKSDADYIILPLVSIVLDTDINGDMVMVSGEVR